jgi:16S rRNA (cytosine1402-N4)-methyltransferase
MTLQNNSVSSASNGAHVPVLLHEAIAVLDPRRGERFIDGTLGACGHATAILERITPHGQFLGIDWDAQAVERARQTLKAPDVEVTVVCDSFAHLASIVAAEQFPRADGLVLDLGFSSEQIAGSALGLSFNRDEPLDMRYGAERSGAVTAAEIVNSWSEAQLADVIYRYGDERRSRQIAKAIVIARRNTRILTSGQLSTIIANTISPHGARGRTHPATKTFLALRTVVNREEENLQEVLGALPNVMAPGGRVAIITFNSREDRAVKQAFAAYARTHVATLITKKPIVPSRTEQIANRRSRSAKLRAIRFV